MASACAEPWGVRTVSPAPATSAPCGSVAKTGRRSRGTTAPEASKIPTRAETGPAWAITAPLGNGLRWRDHGSLHCALPLTGGALAWRPFQRHGGTSGAAPVPLRGGQACPAPSLAVQAQALMAAGAGFQTTSIATERGSEEFRLRLDSVWRHVLPRCATDVRQLCERFDGRINRSKFNVPLGIESQGFCVLK
jgi:hypothetical protein